MVLSLVSTMLLLGLVLGFIGAGGSGFIIAVLVTIFDIPIHTAIGTAVPVMFFSVLTGSLSHFREGNLMLKQGLLVGGFGGLGAYIGMRLTILLNPNFLMFCTVSMLMLSGILIWVKTKMTLHEKDTVVTPSFLTYAGVGLGNGLISGTFGIGAANFIQLSLLKWFDYPMRIAAGTTMLVIIPIAMFASVGSIQNGYFDLMLFLQVAVSTMIGSYLGAKLTGRLPKPILRVGMVGTPILSAVVLLLNFM